MQISGTNQNVRVSGPGPAGGDPSRATPSLFRGAS